VQEWAGLDDASVDFPNPDYDPDAHEDEPESQETLHAGLAELNDDYDYDFKTIADLIEAEL
jgi:hypothetical protein